MNEAKINDEYIQDKANALSVLSAQLKNKANSLSPIEMPGPTLPTRTNGAPGAHCASSSGLMICAAVGVVGIVGCIATNWLLFKLATVAAAAGFGILAYRRHRYKPAAGAAVEGSATLDTAKNKAFNAVIKCIDDISTEWMDTLTGHKGEIQEHIDGLDISNDNKFNAKMSIAAVCIPLFDRLKILRDIMNAATAEALEAVVRQIKADICTAIDDGAERQRRSYEEADSYLGGHDA